MQWDVLFTQDILGQDSSFSWMDSHWSALQVEPDELYQIYISFVPGNPPISQKTQNTMRKSLKKVENFEKCVAIRLEMLSK